MNPWVDPFIPNELRIRFMESPLSFFRMHWDYEPPWVDPFIPNELRVRFIERARRVSLK